MSNYKDIMDFIGEWVEFDQHEESITAINGTYKMQLIAELRGISAMQLMFSNSNGQIDYHAASDFQNRLGQFIAEAINEKMQRERGEHPQVCPLCDGKGRRVFPNCTPPIDKPCEGCEGAGILPPTK